MHQCQSNYMGKLMNILENERENSTINSTIYELLEILVKSVQIRVLSFITNTVHCIWYYKQQNLLSDSIKLIIK